MRMFVTRWTLVVILLTTYGNVAGQPTPSTEMRADILKLLEVTGAADLAVQLIDQSLGPMIQSMPNVPQEFWTKFIDKLDKDALSNMIVPIYAKYFTHDEIKELLTFYQTPLGQKVIATLPSVIRESTVAGQRWGEELGQQVVDELKAEGYH